MDNVISPPEWASDEERMAMYRKGAADRIREVAKHVESGVMDMYVLAGYIDGTILTDIYQGESSIAEMLGVTEILKIDIARDLQGESDD